MVHELKTYEEQPANLPQYRYYVECTCGFASRLATETAVKSQFDAHLRANGVPVVYDVDVKQKSDVGQDTTVKPVQSSWDPFAKPTGSKIKPMSQK